MHNGEALRGVSKTSISSSSESGCFAALCVVTVVDVVADPTSFNCSTFAGLTVEPTLGDATSRDSFDELESVAAFGAAKDSTSQASTCRLLLVIIGLPA